MFEIEIKKIAPLLGFILKFFYLVLIFYAVGRLYPPPRGGELSLVPFTVMDGGTIAFTMTVGLFFWIPILTQSTINFMKESSSYNSRNMQWYPFIFLLLPLFAFVLIILSEMESACLKTDYPLFATALQGLVQIFAAINGFRIIEQIFFSPTICLIIGLAYFIMLICPIHAYFLSYLLVKQAIMPLKTLEIGKYMMKKKKKCDKRRSEFRTVFAPDKFPDPAPSKKPPQPTPPPSPDVPLKALPPSPRPTKVKTKTDTPSLVEIDPFSLFDLIKNTDISRLELTERANFLCERLNKLNSTEIPQKYLDRAKEALYQLYQALDFDRKQVMKARGSAPGSGSDAQGSGQNNHGSGAESLTKEQNRPPFSEMINWNEILETLETVILAMLLGLHRSENTPLESCWKDHITGDSYYGLDLYSLMNEYKEKAPLVRACLIALYSKGNLLTPPYLFNRVVRPFMLPSSIKQESSRS